MDSIKDAFEKVKEETRKNISENAYQLWIKDIEPVSFKDNTVRLFIKSEFKKEIVESKYLAGFESCFSNIFGFPVKVVIDCEKPAPPPAADPTPSGIYEYTFDTFIVGSSNKFAHAASLAVAVNPAGSYNPLFIYGGSGLGKTHLLCAICSEIEKNFPQKKLIYCKGEEFTNELIYAIQTEKTKQFHDKYRSADVLLMDDIQFIAGKESTQEEFFHTFNILYESGKQIVLTSDRPPLEIKTLEDRLRTRFEGGLLADIQPPDFETRVAIIKRKAQAMNIDIPNDVAEYIANRLKTNIRQLEGVVKKLKAYMVITESAPSIIVAQTAIREILSDEQPIPVTVDRIISEVARTYGVSPEDIRSKKRSAQISYARQIAIYIVREITQISMSSIGEEFGGRDHSTMVYAIQQVEKLIKKDPRCRDTVGDIINNIREK